ncbi:MAG: hypothetical protein R6X02_10305 [Enhygromyxa sp.]
MKTTKLTVTMMFAATMAWSAVAQAEQPCGAPANTFESCEIVQAPDCFDACSADTVVSACVAAHTEQCMADCAGPDSLSCEATCDQECAGTPCPAEYRGGGDYDCEVSCGASCMGDCSSACSVAGDKVVCYASCNQQCSAHCEVSCKGGGYPGGYDDYDDYPGGYDDYDDYPGGYDDYDDYPGGYDDYDDDYYYDYDDDYYYYDHDDYGPGKGKAPKAKPKFKCPGASGAGLYGQGGIGCYMGLGHAKPFDHGPGKGGKGQGGKGKGGKGKGGKYFEGHGGPSEVANQCEQTCQNSCSGSCTANVTRSCELDCQANAVDLCRPQMTSSCTEGCGRGAVLMCDGQYVNVSDVDACVAALEQEGISVSGPISALAGDEILASALTGASCSVEEPKRLRFAGMLFTLLGFGLGGSLLRRRRS